MWNIKDKICLITGATSGIGRETAVALAGMGAKVIITYRNNLKAIATKEYILKKTGREIETYFCDFSSFNSIRKFVISFHKKHKELHILINNAGIYETQYKTGEDGHELNFTVNHLAPFLLTTLFLETLENSSPARIINVASESHRDAVIDFDDINHKRNFSGREAYGQSKLANILFTRQLAENLEGSGVTVNCLHPGIVKTNIFNSMNRVAISMFKLIMISPEKGAETSVYLASSPEVEGISGGYFIKNKMVEPSQEALDKKTAKKLWQLSFGYVDPLNKVIEENAITEKHYSNGEITVVWKPNLCTHVTYCYTELPDVFAPSERPWINPFGATTERIIKQVNRCPSGALTYFHNNQKEKVNNMENENQHPQTCIEIVDNGPAIVAGKCIITDKRTGRVFETKNVFTLCRCGRTKDRPYCDGSHIGNTFE